jgi:hypothetical protein
MKKEHAGLSALALASLILSGCTTGNLKTLDATSSNEGIAVARIHCTYDGKDATKGCNIVFDPLPFFGVPKYQYVPDANGYVFAKLPLGVNSIRAIVVSSGLAKHDFDSGELTCHIKGGGVINYLGEIYIDWQKVSVSTSSTVETIGFSARNTFTVVSFNWTEGGGKIGVWVDSNESAAKDAFQVRFNEQRQLTPSLLVARSQK